MTFEQAFKKVKAKFEKADTSKLKIDFAIQVNMTDSDCGGAFYIQSVDGKLNVEPYDYRDNTADVTLKKLDLYKILDGKLDVDTAVESGKVYVNGNIADFAAAASCIVHEVAPKPEKKPAKAASAPKAKKAAAPKTAAKPATKKETAVTAEKPAATIVKTETKSAVTPKAKTAKK